MVALLLALILPAAAEQPPVSALRVTGEVDHSCDGDAGCLPTTAAVAGGLGWAAGGALGALTVANMGDQTTDWWAPLVGSAAAAVPGAALWFGTGGRLGGLLLFAGPAVGGTVGAVRRRGYDSERAVYGLRLGAPAFTATEHGAVVSLPGSF